MKNFDDERAASYYNDDERRFVIAGETFTVRRSVRPEAVDEWATLSSDLPQPEQRAIIDHTILALLEPDSAALWEETRERADDAIRGGDLYDVATFCFRIVAGRPLEQDSASTTGPATETDGTPSTDASSSPAAPEPALSI